MKNLSNILTDVLNKIGIGDKVVREKNSQLEKKIKDYKETIRRLNEKIIERDVAVDENNNLKEVVEDLRQRLRAINKALIERTSKFDETKKWYKECHEENQELKMKIKKHGKKK